MVCTVRSNITTITSLLPFFRIGYVVKTTNILGIYLVFLPGNGLFHVILFLDNTNWSWVRLFLRVVQIKAGFCSARVTVEHCTMVGIKWEIFWLAKKENCRYCLVMKTGKAFLVSHLSKFYCISLDHSHEIFFLSYVKKYYVLSVFKFIKKVNRIM